MLPPMMIPTADIDHHHHKISYAVCYNKFCGGTPVTHVRMLFARQSLGQGRRAGLAMPGLANGLDLMIWPVDEARAAIGSDTPCSICGDALCTAAAAPVSPQTVYPWSGPFPFASADDDVNPVASLIQHSGPWTWQFPCAVNDRIEVFHAACLLDYLARHFVDNEPVRCLVTGTGGFPNALNWLALGRDLFLSLTLSVGVSDMYQRIKDGADGGDDMYIAMQSELRAAWMLARLMAFQLVPLPASSSYNEPLYIHWLLRTAAVGQQWIDHVYDVFVVADNGGNGGNTDDDSVDALVLRIMSVVLDMLSAGARPWTDRASGILWRVLQRLAEHGTNVAVVRQLASVLQQHRHRNNVSFGKSLGADIEGGGDATTLPAETYIAIVEAGRESPALAAAWTDVLREALFNGTFLMPMLMAPGSEHFFRRQPEALMPTNAAILRGLSVSRRRQLFSRRCARRLATVLAPGSRPGSASCRHLQMTTRSWPWTRAYSTWIATLPAFCSFLLMRATLPPTAGTLASCWPTLLHAGKRNALIFSMQRRILTFCCRRRFVTTALMFRHMATWCFGSCGNSSWTLKNSQWHSGPTSLSPLPTCCGPCSASRTLDLLMRHQCRR